MVTKEQAATNREFHRGPCRKYIGPRGGVERITEHWRASGNIRTWATRPDDFRLPIKYGLYRSDEITQHNAREFHLAEDCKPITVGPGAPKDDGEERHYSWCICADCSGAELTAKND